jgi:spore maturation protein CgeB
MRKFRIVRLVGLHLGQAGPSLSTIRGEFRELSFREQLEALMESRILFSNSFSHSMTQIGHEAYELIWDCEVLQKTWAAENGLKITDKNWMLEVLVAQLSIIQPEIIYFQGTELCIPGRFGERKRDVTLPMLLREKFPFIRLQVMFSGYPSSIKRTQGVDILFGCSPAVVRSYKYYGTDCLLCYHGFDSRVLNELGAPTREKNGLSFVGATQAPRDRYWLIKKLMEETSLELWIDSADESGAINSQRARSNISTMVVLKRAGRRQLEKLATTVSQSVLQQITQRGWCPSKLRQLADDTLFRQYVHGPDMKLRDLELPNTVPEQTLGEVYPGRCAPQVVGLDYYNVIRNSQVTVNRHTDKSMGSVGNMRMFEATGVGTCLLTDSGENMGDLFLEGKEVVTYRTAKEATDKSQYLMKNEKECAEIALAGQSRTLKEHTIEQRCQYISEIIESRI